VFPKFVCHRKHDSADICRVPRAVPLKGISVTGHWTLRRKGLRGVAVRCLGSVALP
jgi:hypothetical protein